MARARLPEGQQRSGSIGGATWSRNRYGVYIRERTQPVNPNTQRQVQVRNYLSQISTRWNSTLTDLQREAWRLYAANTTMPGAFGEETFIQGKDMYVRGNVNRLIAGLDIVDDGPTVFGLPDAPTDLIVTSSAATQLCSVAFYLGDAWVNEDDAAMLVYLGAPQNPSHLYFGRPYRYMATVLGDATTPPTTPDEETAPWAIGEGQAIWVRARAIMADGRVSDWAQSRFLGGA
jgi:hypothetical protein